MKFRSLLLALLAAASCFGAVNTAHASLIGITGSRLTLDTAEQPTGDVFSYVPEAAVARNANFATKTSFFQGGGWNSCECSDLAEVGGTVYTATTASLGISANPAGSAYVIVQEFFPASLLDEWLAQPGHEGATWQDFQPNPWLQFGEQTDSDGHLPANVWFRIWTMFVEEFDADIGAGTQSFTSTKAPRDKWLYPSREEAPDPLYNATFTDGLNWDLVPGACGFEGINAHLSIPSCPTDELFLALDTAAVVFGAGGADNALVGESDQHRLYQNLNNTTGKIVKGIWTEVTLHYDTSGANGTWEAWIKKQGQARVKVAEWIGGTTPSFTWSIPSDQRVGHKAFQLWPVISGTAAGNVGDQMIVTGSIDVATSAADLPDYDDGGPIAMTEAANDAVFLVEAANDDVFRLRASR